MGIYGDQWLNETFLTEAGVAKEIEKRIDKLKNNKKITKEDIDGIVRDIKKVSDKNIKSTLAAYVISLIITVIGGALTGVAIGFSAVAVIGWIGAMASLIIGGIDSDLYSRAVKVEDDIEKKINKLESKGSLTVEEQKQMKELKTAHEIAKKITDEFTDITVKLKK